MTITSTSILGTHEPERFTAEWLLWAYARVRETSPCPLCRAGAGTPCRAVRKSGGTHRVRFTRWAERYVEAVTA